MSSEEIKNLRRKLKKARENGKLQEISDCCCNLAAYLSDEEEHEEALKLYKESLNACEKLENKEGAALANRMIAEECINLGYFDDALNHVSVFLKYAKDKGDKVEEQRGFVLKGHVYFTQAEYLMDTKPKEFKKVEQLLEQSMEAYRKSFAICNTELNDISERERLQMKARLLQNKSLVLSRQNKLDYAQGHLIRAIKICTKEKLNDTEHICYLSLGDLYLKKGEPQKALNVYDRAFELSHSTQKKRDSLVGKAKTYIVMENFQQAKLVLKKVYKLKPDEEVKKLLKQVASVIRLESNLCSTPDTELKARKDLYKKLGDAYCSLKNYKNGIKCYLNMLGCAQKAGLNRNDLIKCYILLCRAFTADKQYDKALFYSHQEVESLSKWAPEKAYKTYLRIAELHELNGSDFEEIHFAYSKAKLKAQQSHNIKLQIKCLKRLINIGQTFNKPELVSESEKELQVLKSEENDSASGCDSGNDSESEASSDSEENSEESSETDFKDLVSDSDIENEEYDRPKERCKRTKFTIKRNEKGETDLHVAAIKGNYKRVKQLIDQGHPVNVRDTAGWTPLHEACNHGYVDIVNILLDFGANINDKGGPSCDGTTPLHDAAINGQLEVVETLIKRGASSLVLNDSGQTPLQCLLAWKKSSALDAEEDAMFQNIVKSLKSPLDSEDIKRHLKSNKNLIEKKFSDSKPRRNSTDLHISDTEEKPNSNDRFKKSSVISEYRETIQSLRGKRGPRQENSRGSHSEDDNCSNFKRIGRGKSACEEYKEAIDDLRYKPKKTSPSDSVKSKPKPALIDAREYVDNCIMDNDDDDEELEDAEPIKTPVLIEEEEEDRYSQPRKRRKSSPTIYKKPSLEEELKSKSWLKSIPLDLIKDSFEISPSKGEDMFKPPNESETDIFTQFPNEDVDTSTASKITNITVKILNEKIKISVNESEVQNLNVSWLIKEVSKKHSAAQNPDNFVSVRLEDEMKKESDPLLELAGREIEFVVTKWKSLPLDQRYEKVCTVTSHPDISSEVRYHGFKHSVHPEVAEILHRSSKSRSITLSNLKLSSLTLIPICKAIKYESFVQSLDLSNNYFGDKGIELIVKIFEKCIVEELDVSGCNVTSSGVYHFSHALNNMNELTKNGLEVLNLGNNPITDDAVPAINNIIEQLPNLRTVNVDHCELETVISSNNSASLIIIQGNKYESPQRSSNTKTASNS